MIDGSVLQSAQRCFEKKSRVVVKTVVKYSLQNTNTMMHLMLKVNNFVSKDGFLPITALRLFCNIQLTLGGNVFYLHQ